MSGEHFAVSAEMTEADWSAAAALAEATVKTFYLVEYTKGNGHKPHFERVEADTPEQAADRFIDSTSNTYVQQVWQSVERRDQ